MKDNDNRTRRPLFKRRWLRALLISVVAAIALVAVDRYFIDSNSASVVVSPAPAPIAEGEVFLFATTTDSVSFLIDTGYPQSYISEDDARRLNAHFSKPVVIAIMDIHKTYQMFFKKVRVDSLPLAEGVYLKDAEFVLESKGKISRNVLGMDILKKTTLLLQHSAGRQEVCAYMLPSRPAEYSHKLMDLRKSGGYLRDIFSFRTYADLALSGRTNRYFLDTGASISIKIPTADSTYLPAGSISSWTESIIRGSHSIRTVKEGAFHYTLTYSSGGTQQTTCKGEGVLYDLITKYAINPVVFFPFSVAIDFPNMAIYTDRPIDFCLEASAEPQK